MSFWDDKDAVHRLYQEAFSPPPGITAYLDLASGLVRLNMTAPEFTHWWGGLKRDFSWDSKLETLHHEGTHFLQVLNYGYLFVLVSRLFAIVRESMVSTDDWLHEGPHVCSAHRDELSSLIGHLDAPGEAGLTPRIILESATFHTQKRYINGDLNAAEFGEILDRESPSMLYRDAYDVALEVIGDSAFNSFQFICYRALCSRNPVKSFIAICQEVADRRLRLDTYDRVSAKCPDDIMPFVRAADKATGDDYIGGSSLVMTRMDGPVHPFYAKALESYIEEQQHDEALGSYPIAPHLAVRDFNLILRQPILFNQTAPDSANWELAFLSRAGRTRLNEFYNQLIASAAVSAKIIGRVLSDDYSPPQSANLHQGIPSAQGWNVKSRKEIVDSEELRDRIERLQYVAFSSPPNLPLVGVPDESLNPNPQLLDFLLDNLRQGESQFSYGIVMPGEPQRTFVVSRLTPTSLYCTWVRETGGLITKHEAHVAVLPRKSKADDEQVLRRFGELIPGIESKIDSETPGVLACFLDSEIQTSAWVRSVNLHLGLAALEFSSNH